LRALTIVALAALAVGAAEASAQRQTASLALTSAKPNAPSGLELRIDYASPADPAAKPPAVRRVAEKLARGAAFDTSAPELCAASDLELMVLGAAACPSGSVVGEGEIVVDTGIPGARRLVSDVTFLNNTGQLIFVAAVGPARLVIRASQGGREAVSQAPFLPGTLPDGAAIDTVAVDLDRVVTERGSYITTPPRCPRSRRWVHRTSFTYFDGAEETVKTRQRCRRP
jgi:hypothetical protein